jgi:hypothetical protein
LPRGGWGTQLTGLVTWEVLLWVVGIIVGAGVAVATFLFWVWRIVERVKNDSGNAIGIVAGKLDLVETDLATYKQHVGETFATKDGVTLAIGRVEASVDRIGSQVDGGFERLSGRIDRLLEMRSGDASARRSSTRGGG